MRSLRTGTIPATPAASCEAQPAGEARQVQRSEHQNAPALDVRSYLYQMTRVDLTRIDGVDEHTALKVITEIGLDMSWWETVKNFTSWLGLCPNHRVTGGKVIAGAVQGHRGDGSQAGADQLPDAEGRTRLHGHRSRLLRAAAATPSRHL